MNTLLAYASRHGSTREIAEAIAEKMRKTGLDVDLMDCRDVTSIDEYDAVVLGSAIYIGQWLSHAREFVDRFEHELRKRPVWIFTSGPIGDDPFPKEESQETAKMAERTGARGHHSFTGKLDRSQLGIPEKVVTKVVRAPAGDFRDWEEIRGWARDISLELQQIAPVQ